jgi:hypothetical protein
MRLISAAGTQFCFVAESLDEGSRQLNSLTALNSGKTLENGRAHFADAPIPGIEQAKRFINNLIGGLIWTVGDLLANHCLGLRRKCDAHWVLPAVT